MLSYLFIKNFAIIEEIELNFDPKLNILIGETGAGKSIIIDALQILLGDKASVSFIRQGFSKSIIEGHFILPKNHPVCGILSENDIELLDNNNERFQLLLRREINLNSSTRNFINDTPVQLNVLKSIGDLLIDFHGQYSHQLLLNPKNHIDILDAFGNNFEILKQYQSEFFKFKNLQLQLQKFLEEKEAFQKSIESKKNDLDLINSINPKINEDVELLKELKIIENSEVLFNYYSEIANLLYDSDNSVLNHLVIILKKMEYIAKINPQINAYLNETEKLHPILNELKSHIIESLDTISYNPTRIEEINQRLFNLNNLIRKFGKIDEIIEYRTKLESEVNSNLNYNAKQQELENKLDEHYELVRKYAELISNMRYKHKPEFEKVISNLLIKLGFDYINFKINIISNKSTLTSKGFDTIEFLISTNKGEDPKPLVNVASGGETSRIMLALKSMAADDLNLPVLVFDEIDIGVSGSVAHKIALQMKSLSKKHQIVAITHSPQVTAAADRVIEVHKEEKDNRTITKINLLDEGQLVLEIAKFLSNSNVSDIAIQNAKELRQSTII